MEKKVGSYRIIPRFCLDCGKQLTGHHNNSKRCKSCARKHQYATRPETHPMLGKTKELAPNFKRGDSLKTYYCMDCKIEINWQTATKGNYRCKKCADIVKRKNYPQLYCVDCNKKLSKKAEYNGIERCKSCARKYFLELNPMPKGKNAYHFIHGEGYAPYPIDFNDQLKEQIRKRDNFECQNCGMTEEEHLIIIGTDLHIHHIDYNKKNCNKNNLITLCKQCNLRANGNIDYWQNFYTRKLECLKNV